MGARKKPDNEQLPILFPAEGEESVDGLVLTQLELKRRGDTGPQIKEKGRQTEFLPVKRFVLGLPDTKRSQEIIHLLNFARAAFARGKSSRPQLDKETFRTLMGDAFRLPVTDALSDQALEDPKYASRRWLPAYFNRAITGTRMVMWWPEDSTRFSPAVYCKDKRTAVLVSLLFGGVEVCPGCGAPFIRRRKQRFHSTNCAARYGMRAKRMRDEQRRKKGKGHAKN